MDNNRVDVTASMICPYDFFDMDGNYMKRMYKWHYIDVRPFPEWALEQMRQEYRNKERTFEMDSFILAEEERIALEAEIEWIDSHSFGYNPY